MNSLKLRPGFRAAGAVVGTVLAATVATAGVVDPECTAKKAATSAATKAVVGVGGRCGAAETVTDTTKRAVGIEQQGPVEKALGDDDDGLAKKGAKAVKKAVAD